MIPELPLRPISLTEAAQYRENGVVCLRGMFPPEWVISLKEVVSRIASDPALLRGAPVPDGTFLGDSFLWKTIDECRDFAYGSPAAHLAQQLLSSTGVHFFFDQIFVKPPGCPVVTPWHQDHSFWPVNGSQIVTIWMALSDISRESSALEFVRGSHRWPSRYKAVRPDRLAYLLESDLEEPPDVDRNRSDFEIISWKMQLGDVLAFNSFVLHGSPANLSAVPRLAFATRWVGDDVYYMPDHAKMRFNWRHNLQPGDRLGGTLFPQILPHTLGKEFGVRQYGPEARDPALMEESRQLYAEAELRRSRQS